MSIFLCLATFVVESNNNSTLPSTLKENFLLFISFAKFFLFLIIILLFIANRMQVKSAPSLSISDHGSIPSEAFVSED